MSLFSRLFRRRSAAPANRATTTSPAPLQWVGGRLVLQADPYVLPKDLLESNRLDFQHYMLRYALQGHDFLAPIEQPRRILDVGCGTGRWAREMARQFPSASVTGVDLVLPTENPSVTSTDGHAENCVFAEGNVLKGLSFPDQSFDFVHMRLLYSAIPAASWPAVVQELVRLTRPGGWIELVEAASLENRGPAVDQMNTWVVEACRRRGLDMTLGRHIGEMLEAAGISHVTFRELSLPVGEFGGRLGKMLETDIIAILKASKPLVVNQQIASTDAYDELLGAWQAEVAQRPMTFPFYFAFGQRL